MICHPPQNYSSPIEYQNYLVTTMGVPTPPPPPPPHEKKKKNKPKNQGLPLKKRQKKKKKKKKKRELSLRILPRRTRLFTSLYRVKARKAWPTATILYEIFEFSEIYVCQKY